jgi:predicted nucleic acid-binding protein
MARYVVDAFAWVEYLAATPLGARARAIVEDEENDILTAALSVSEIVSRAQREGRDGRRAAELVEGASVVVPRDFTLAVTSGIIHEEKRRQVRDFPHGDGAILAVAKRLKAKVLTGDPHFREMENVEFLA